MKMWVAKTVHPLELVRNLDRYKRLILASLMSAVLVISIVFVGSFLLTGQSVSSDGPSYVKIFVDRVDMWNYTFHGPRWYNITTNEGLVTLQVTNITIPVATYSNMLLISCLDGRNLTMKVPSATATKITVYTTYTRFGGIEVYEEIYGNDTYDAPSPGWEPPPGGYYMAITNVRMNVVYMHLESLSAPQGLNLTVT